MIKRIMLGLILALAGILGATALAPASASGVTPGPTAVSGSGPVANFIGEYFEIRNSATNKCASVKDRSVTAGATVHEWTCANANNDLWAPQPLGNGYYWLVNRNSGMCLDIRTNDSSLFGKSLQQFPCNIIYSSEQWRFDSAGPPRFNLVSAANPGYCAALRGGSSANGTAIEMYNCSIGDPLGKSWRLT